MNLVIGQMRRWAATAGRQQRRLQPAHSRAPADHNRQMGCASHRGIPCAAQLAVPLQVLLG